MSIDRANLYQQQILINNSGACCNCEVQALNRREALWRFQKLLLSAMRVFPPQRWQQMSSNVQKHKHKCPFICLQFLSFITSLTPKEKKQKQKQTVLHVYSLLTTGNIHHNNMYLTVGHINIALLLLMNADKVLFWIILSWNKNKNVFCAWGITICSRVLSLTWTQIFIFINNRCLQNTIWQSRPLLFLFHMPERWYCI